MPAETQSTDSINVPKGWDCVELDRLVDPSRGISYGIVQPGSLDADGVPVVRVNNLRDGRIETTSVLRASRDIESKYERTRLRGGEVLLSLVGTLGECAVVPAELHGWNVARAIGVIPLKPGTDPRWVTYCLRSTEVQALIRAWATTTVQATLNLRDVRRLPILLAPDRLGASITDVVSSLDDKIEQNRRTTRTLQRLARAIFRAWFVDFEPVKAKAAGATSFRSMPQAVFDALPTQLLDSEIGALPEDWHARALGTLVNLNKGLSYKGGLLSDDGHPMINLGCFLGEGRFDPKKLKGYRGEYKPRHLVEPGTLILANTDVTQNRTILGSPAIVEDWVGKAPYLFTHHVFAARPIDEAAKAWLPYIYYLLMTSTFRERAEGFATGTTVLGLPRDAVEACKFAFPPEDVRDAFVSIAEPIDRLRRSNDEESQKLAEARDYLLPRFLSGSVRVENING